MNTQSDDDFLDFFEEEDPASAKKRNSFWRLLIVDDDTDVHSATTFALSNLDIHHRHIEFLHAYSAVEARQVLAVEKDIAAILLDVVMEEEDSGLKLVKVIRGELGLTDVRIILRTGQPGYAPELEVVREYDINDYKTKADLTRTKLFTAVTAAVRSYDQIRTINISRRGLDIIIKASTDLMALHGLQSFAVGIITQITGLLGLPPESLVCSQNMSPEEDGEDLIVVAAAGHYESLLNASVDTISDPAVREALHRCMKERRSIYEDNYTCLFLSGQTKHDMATYLDLREPLDTIDRQLLEVFCGNIAVGLDNVALFSELNHINQNLDNLVKLRTEELNESLRKLEYANEQIVESLQYARKIQMAILPPLGEVSEYTHDHFIIWNPKDLIGGDIYWLAGDENGFLIAVIDCTGHSVPGAIMTMIAGTTLSRVASELGPSDPARILERMDRLVRQTLSQNREETESNDGLDIGLCYVRKDGMVVFSGAHLSLFVLDASGAREIKASKQSIGYKSLVNKQASFVNQEVRVEPGMNFYMFTDGIRDQIGGEKGIPFGKNRLLQILGSVRELTMAEQRQAVLEAFENYRHNEAQRDDITVFGFRLNQ